MKISQNECASAKIEIIGDDGEIIASKIQIYDGVVRDQAWPDYERHMGYFKDDYLYEKNYDKTSGRNVESRGYLESNGDLRFEEVHTLPNQPSYQKTTYYRRMH